MGWLFRGSSGLFCIQNSASFRIHHILTDSLHTGWALPLSWFIVCWHSKYTAQIRSSTVSPLALFRLHYVQSYVCTAHKQRWLSTCTSIFSTYCWLDDVLLYLFHACLRVHADRLDHYIADSWHPMDWADWFHVNCIWWSSCKLTNCTAVENLSCWKADWIFADS